MRMRKTVRAKKSTHAGTSSRYTAIGAGVVVLVVTCVIGAAMLIAARQPSETLEMTSADVRPVRGGCRRQARRGRPWRHGRPRRRRSWRARWRTDRRPTAPAEASTAKSRVEVRIR
jgi:hypothetical protein